MSDDTETELDKILRAVRDLAEKKEEYKLVSPKEISVYLDKDLNNVHSRLNELFKKGFVEKPLKRVFYKITKDGEEYLDRLVKIE